MTSPNLLAPLGAPNRSAIVLPGLPAFDADLSAYDVILNGDPDLKLVDACIHQLEEHKELLKKDRDNADTRSAWLQNQGITALTTKITGIVSLGTSSYTLIQSHSSSWVTLILATVSILLAIANGVFIVVILGASSRSDVEPSKLRETAERLGGSLASFRILKDQLEDDARKADAGQPAAPRRRFGRSR